MNKKNTTRDMVVTALLTALSVVIPMISFRIDIPPFSATIAAHVPVVISMFISPWSALFVSVGNTLGFLFRGVPLVIVARAASHIVFAVTGAYLVRSKKNNLVILWFLTTILHALMEALVVLPFGFNFYLAFYVTGIGTIVHHTIDFIIAIAVAVPLAKANAIPPLPRRNSVD